MTAFVDTQTFASALQTGPRRIAGGEFDAPKRVAHDIWMPSAAGLGTIKGIILPPERVRIFRNESRLYTWTAWTTSGVTLTVGYAAYTLPIVTGSVNTATTAVTWVSGDLFSIAWQNGGTINIGGVAYTISSVTDPFHLTLTGTAGTQSAVLYDRTGLAEAANAAFFHDSVSPQGAVIDEVQDGYGSPGTQPYVDFYTANGLQLTYTVATQNQGVLDVLDVYVTYAELIGG